MLDEASGVETRPGLVRPRRFRPRFHWELLVCGLAGHELVGLDARTLRPADAVVARDRGHIGIAHVVRTQEIDVARLS